MSSTPSSSKSSDTTPIRTTQRQKRRFARHSEHRILYSDYSPKDARNYIKLFKKIIEVELEKMPTSEKEFFDTVAEIINQEVVKLTSKKKWKCIVGNDFSIASEAVVDTILFSAIGDVKILMYQVL